MASCRSLERSRSIAVMSSCVNRQSATLRSFLAHFPASRGSSARLASLIRSHSGVQRKSTPAGWSGEIGSRRSSFGSSCVGIGALAMKQDQLVHAALSRRRLSQRIFRRYFAFGLTFFIHAVVLPFDPCIGQADLFYRVDGLAFSASLHVDAGDKYTRHREFHVG